MSFKNEGLSLTDIFVTKSEVMGEYGNFSNDLLAWGYNSEGELGDGSVISRSSPIQTISGGTNWSQAVCCYLHTAAIKTDGTLWSWGYNYYGQLGNNDSGLLSYRSSPVQTICGGTNWSQIVSGFLHTAAIKTDGTLWSWGLNDLGQLGNSSIISRSSPIQTISGGTNWKQITSSGYQTAAIKTDGTLWSWGRNNVGQLGDNTIINRSSPVQTISGGTNWNQVSCGSQHTAAIKTDGTLWSWGYNNYGQLGDNTIINRSSPVQIISGGTNWSQVSCGGYVTAAIKTDGALWIWGANYHGQLGDNTLEPKSSPVQTICGGTNWMQPNSGDIHTSAIKTDGTLWLWGNNDNARLGTNNRVARSSPVQTVSGGTNWGKVSCGGSHTVAIRYNTNL